MVFACLKKQKDLVNFDSGDGDISRLTSSHPKSLKHVQNFYLKVEHFTKNGDKFGLVKCWLMTFNSSNSPKFSPATILCFTVYAFIQASVLYCGAMAKPLIGDMLFNYMNKMLDLLSTKAYIYALCLKSNMNMYI